MKRLGEAGRRIRCETHKFDTPAQDGGLEVLGVSQGASFEDLGGVNDGHAAVELSAGDIVVQTLRNEGAKCQ